MQKITIRNILAIVFAFAVFIFSLFFGGGAGVSYAATAAYSDVLDDLQKDSDFDASYYPEVSDDYSLQVIQLAESSDKELFVYVYQPYTGTKYDLTATTITISTAINDSLYYVLYNLTLINSSGVFYKYLVEDFTVKDDTVRYYDVTAIRRKYYEDIDSDDGLTTEKAFSVGALWTMCTVDGEVTYTKTTHEVVTIEGQWCSYILYPDGYYIFHEEYTASSFVAFSCDYDIDTLLSADITYTIHDCEIIVKNGITSSITYGEESDYIYDTLNYDEYGSNVNPVLWLSGKKVSWQRIQSIDEFYETDGDNLSDEAKENLSDKQWVLRFYDTTYNVTYSFGDWVQYVYTYFSAVSNVVILKLTFEVAGETKTLGVVDNISTQTQDPAGVGKNDFELIIDGASNFWDNLMAWLEKFMQSVGLVVGIILIALLVVLLFPILKPILTAIFKGIWWFISFPFKLIAKLFKKDEDE